MDRATPPTPEHGESPTTRLENGFGGPVSVPATALWGAQTQRAVDVFRISDLRPPRRYLGVLGSLKRAAAWVNVDLDLLDPTLGRAIVAAAAEVADGRLDGHFPVDVFQTGSGTNTNMNANEVIANRANQLLGLPLGTRSPIHPNDHVNLGQSSNDVTPTVLHVAALAAIRHDLVPALGALTDELTLLAARTMHVVKSGRTHLQDAVPIRLGQEFLGHAGQMQRAVERIEAGLGGLGELALGGTAVGTGLNTHPAFAAGVIAVLSDEYDIDLRETDNHFQAQNNLDATVFVSGALTAAATGLLKIADDIRWMSSGPRAGLGEIEVPDIGMSSSIMPGKTNPVVAEAVCQVAAKVIGNDATLIVAGTRGNFELTTMMPVAAHCLLESVDLLTNATTVFTQHCVSGIEATPVGPALVERNLMMATALSPRVGYDKAAEIAQAARGSDRSVREAAIELAGLTGRELDDLLDAGRMTDPHQQMS